VLARAFDAGEPVDPGRMMELLAQGTRARHLPQMLGPEGWRRRLVAQTEEAPRTLATVYAAIAEASGARVIVDSSKLPTYGFLLGYLPKFDPYVVHLVRDPRAAAYSWLRKKELPEGGFMQRQGPLKSSLLWTLWNAAAGWFWADDPERYLQVRYEDFVREPRATVERITAFLEEPMSGSPFASETEVRLGTTHGVAGNPSRFVTGVVALRSDDEWKSKLRTRDRRVVTAATFPLLRRYGYR